MGAQDETGICLPHSAGTEEATQQVLEDCDDYSADALGGGEKGEVSVTTDDGLQSTFILRRITGIYTE